MIRHITDKRSKKRDDSYFAIARRRRNRYIKIIVIPIVAAAIVLGIVFATQASEHGIGARMVVHIHPHLSIVDNGKSTVVPSQIGINSSLWKDHSLDKYGLQGLSPLHTHDNNGTIHVESNVNRTYTLGEFLNIWGGYDLNSKTVKATVDGKPISDYRNLILRDGEPISLEIGQ